MPPELRLHGLPDRRVVAVEGGIGAGKTTTATLVARRLDIPVVLEDTDKHPFLEAFYDRPDLYAFETEVGFVLLHAHQMKRAQFPLCVTDFSIGKDLLFARLSLKGKEFSVFESVYDCAMELVGKPHLVVFLDIDVQTMLLRIHSRGRRYEAGISETYLARVVDEYANHIAELGQNVVRLPVTPDMASEEVAEAVCRIVTRWRADFGHTSR